MQTAAEIELGVETNHANEQVDHARLNSNHEHVVQDCPECVPVQLNSYPMHAERNTASDRHYSKRMSSRRRPNGTKEPPGSL